MFLSKGIIKIIHDDDIFNYYLHLMKCVDSKSRRIDLDISLVNSNNEKISGILNV